MQNSPENWDDLRLLLAVSRAGSFLHAGRMLGVAASTVQRRVGALERRVGVRLVERQASGVSATPEGRRLLGVATEVEGRLGSATRDLQRSEAELTGKVRVSAGEGFGPFLLGVATRFRAEHPAVEIELMLEAQLVDLVRREADIGIRNVKPSARPLLARKLGQLGYGLYASRSYLGARQLASSADLAEHAIVTVHARTESPEMKWFRRLGVSRFALVTSSPPLVEAAVHTGFGIGALPHVLARGSALIRVLPELALPGLSVWLAMHAELRRVERIRLLARAIAAAFTRETAGLA